MHFVLLGGFALLLALGVVFQRAARAKGPNDDKTNKAKPLT